MADANQPLKTHRGNCHCGAFIYEVELPEIKAVSACNCSICTKKGYLWVKPSEIKAVKGDENALTDYTFGSKTFHHKVNPIFQRLQRTAVRLTCPVLPKLRHPSPGPWIGHACCECNDTRTVVVVVTLLTTVGPFHPRLQPLGGGDWNVRGPDLLRQ